MPAAPRVVHVTPLSVVVPPTVVFQAGSPPEPEVPGVVHSKQIPKYCVELVETILSPRL
jgi:hypothetical protein